MVERKEKRWGRRNKCWKDGGNSGGKVRRKKWDVP